MRGRAAPFVATSSAPRPCRPRPRPSPRRAAWVALLHVLAAVQRASGADRPRVPFVFFAGVEGTGHHWHAAMFNKCRVDPGCEAKRSLVGPFSWQRAAATWVSKMTTESLAATLGAEAAASEAAASVGSYYAVNAFQKDFHAKAITAIEAKGRAAYPQPGQMMSYPSYGDTKGVAKALKMPDMTYMAQALERGAPATSQLRVCLTTRNASDIVESVCDHRHFGGTCPREIAILTLAASAITTQILELPPPPFAVCETYALEDLEGRTATALELSATFKRFGAFLNVDADKAATFARAATKKHGPRRHLNLTTAAGVGKADLALEANSPERAALVEKLRRAQAAAVTVCERHGKRQHHPV